MENQSPSRKRSEPEPEPPQTEEDNNMGSNNSTHRRHTNTSSPSSSTTTQQQPTDESSDSEEGDENNNQAFRALIDKISSKLITSNNSDESLLSGQLVALTELCDILSFTTSDASNSTLEKLSPVLVSLAKQEMSPDVMLFSIRAITYLCDASHRSTSFLVKHHVVPALCSPLLSIQYLDVAEQCLQALQKISQIHPLHCLQAGAIMSILTYIDFFPSSVQRVGVTTIANICKRLPSNCSAQLMEAVPVMCNLLNYDDHKLVENVATCLISIVDNVRHSTEMLDQLCEHGLIQRVTHLISPDSGPTLSQPIHTGLIGLLSQLASGSKKASNTLFELKISSTVKHILCSADLSHGKPYSLVASDPRYNQIHEVMKLLNVLLPPLSTNGEDDMEVSDKERIIIHQPELLRQFGADILPVLVQVVSSGVDLYVSYGCLSVINKIVYFSRSDMLVDLLNSTSISSFLAGIIALKDLHLLMLALRIVKTVMQELHGAFLDSFIKEGIVYAIDALVTPEKCSQFLLQASNRSSQLLSRANPKMAVNGAFRCLCYAYNMDQPPSSKVESCKLDEASVHTMAKHIMTTYFTTESPNSQFGLTRVLEKLKILCAALSDTVNMPLKNDICQQEERLTQILGQIMEELNGEESVSTFEFVESGIVSSLVDYLSNGCYRNGKVDPRDLSSHLDVLQRRYEVFARFCLSSTRHLWKSMPLARLIGKLQSALSTLENLPVILHHISKPRETHAAIPSERATTRPCLKVRFVKVEGEVSLCDSASDVVTVEAFTSLDAIERYLWPKVSTSRSQQVVESATGSKEQPKNSAENIPESASTSQDGKECMTSNISNNTHHLIFYLGGEQLDQSLTLYQAVLQLKMKTENELIVGPSFWNEVYEIAYGKATEQNPTNIPDFCLKSHTVVTSQNHPQILRQNALCISSLLFGEPPYSIDKLSPTYEILILLKILEVINKSAFHIVSYERRNAFSVGQNSSLDNLMVTVCRVPQTEFVSMKLTEKLEQQMRESSVVSAGSMPSWCVQLMKTFPFLFGFEARCKYLHLTLYDPSQVQPPSANNSNDRRSYVSGLPRKKYKISRSHILESAAKMMGSNTCHKTVLEVEYVEEVGTGLGPTMEFFTLVSQEFQKVGLGLWREDHGSLTLGNSLEVENSGYVMAPFGHFPRPWPAASGTSNKSQFTEALKKFVLLGQIVAKAIQDRRVLDLSLSKSFYKLILEQELNLYDVHSFDPGLGRALIEFQALVDRKKVLDLVSSKSRSLTSDSCFHNTRIEDLCLDFTLPGYPDYLLKSEHDHKMVDMFNLEEYVSSIADATVHSGVSRQVEAFKIGFNQVLPIRSLKIFTDEELDQLLCGEQSAWTYHELFDHIKFDHGYTASSPPIINLLEVMQELESKQQRAFLQFVTGAPRLPPGGLAALNPKLTIVRKEILRERLLYAITEGQGCFHLS
ncbi:hypothetical protein IFM89_022662 [Coptis chinensis]|uniref:HECT-type E3 ubiquitin transferase n=1 Tax=Coptis chinensis TaxID=261450 RepID=A0A835H523_9MAGN|nr:hypothetical protein IFM89_022662 [Coptis chinensis]